VPNNRLTWVVGDIHGCHTALASLEKRILKFSKRKGCTPFLVSVGDLIDRGPGSMQVVARFMAGTEAGTHAAVAGNHEALLLRTLLNERPDLFEKAEVQRPDWVEPADDRLDGRSGYSQLATPAAWSMFQRLMWTSQGGAEALISYGCDPQDPGTWDIPADHIRYLARLPLMVEDEHCVVTHALATKGDLAQLRAGQTLDRRSVHRVMWSRALPTEPPDPVRVHASGHTPLSRVSRDRRRRLIRLDLGACWSGRLAAWCPSLDRTISVPSEVFWQRGA
jgi:hypothetical protein